MPNQPKPQPPHPDDMEKMRTRTTQWNCFNLYPGIEWKPESQGSKYGECLYYDDSEYLQQLADWEENNATDH